MAKFSLCFLLLLLTIISTAAARSISPPPPPPPLPPHHQHHHPHHRRSSSGSSSFIEEQCKGTHYYKLCVESLSYFQFANPSSTTHTPEELARLALRVSLVRARLTSRYISNVARDLKIKKTRDYPAVRDCLEQINDGVNQLTNSVKELGKMTLDRENGFPWHESNINSWLSTAQTDALTCMDGFSGHAMGGKLKATIRSKVLNLAQLTSNALAFFNRYAKRHRASRP
ncbi:OLC1v1002187C1 [Oldenlandia corymbosa var. corymbosa]|uniref:OLC1v1002187C1 n=1 Tax=Oldenlandia corymbosa var. corymbosa TaxID=529605 RepID=A0AAV1D9W4_OLDCO|nr:OLC1v1002187C1 [Oldenlandia corymbosa var. corymbosa]